MNKCPIHPDGTEVSPEYDLGQCRMCWRVRYAAAGDDRLPPITPIAAATAESPEPEPAEDFGPLPLVSVFTPTHAENYLPEVWQTLLAQTYTNWEWVVVPNGPRGGIVARVVSQLAGGDSRVKIHPYPEPTCSRVGALKRYACDNSGGAVLVELDHDDRLSTDCLAEVVAAVRLAGRPAFVYSDGVTCGFDGRCQLFDQGFGWRYYRDHVDGEEVFVNATPPAHPRSLCEILYAPDHVRAWTRSAYALAGGHDPQLAFGDDHDLVVRSYLAGVAFRHIKRPLYVHRVSETNTSRVKIEEISRQSRAVRDARLPALVAEWCRRKSLPMYDLGGAFDCPAGYVPIDAHLPCGVPGFRGDVFDVLPDLPDSSVGCFRAHDFLEHVPAARVVDLMNLLYAKLVPGGFVLSHTPAVCDDEGRAGRGASQDPTHVSLWSSNSFWYYTDEFYRKYLNGRATCRFQTVSVANHYPTDFHRLHLIPYVLWYGMALKDDDKHYFPGPKKV